MDIKGKTPFDQLNALSENLSELGEVTTTKEDKISTSVFLKVVKGKDGETVEIKRRGMFSKFIKTFTNKYNIEKFTTKLLDLYEKCKEDKPRLDGLAGKEKLITILECVRNKAESDKTKAEEAQKSFFKRLFSKDVGVLKNRINKLNQLIGVIKEQAKVEVAKPDAVKDEGREEALGKFQAFMGKLEALDDTHTARRLKSNFDIRERLMVVMGTDSLDPSKVNTDKLVEITEGRVQNDNKDPSIMLINALATKDINNEEDKKYLHRCLLMATLQTASNKGKIRDDWEDLSDKGFRDFMVHEMNRLTKAGEGDLANKLWSACAGNTLGEKAKSIGFSNSRGYF